MIKENPEYEKIVINTVDEDETPEIQDKYSYRLVPNFWIGEEKIFEGVPKKAIIKDVLDKALKNINNEDFESEDKEESEPCC
ncbi:MAG: glutaredoxin [Clostridiaceae bacterium]